MHFTPYYKNLLLSFILFLPLSSFSQTEAYKNNKISAYTNYYASKFKDSEKDSTQSSRRKRSTEDKTKSVQTYIELKENADLNLLSDIGVRINSIFETIITAEIPLSALDELAQLDEVVRIEFALPVKRKMDEARKQTHVTEVQSQLINQTRYTGKGVVIGVIDGGFDYNHINFKDKNGNLRIKKIWDQNSKVGEKPWGYSYGTEYNTEEEILNAQDDATHSDGSHGTHVLGIAAGSDKSNDNIFFGVAPEAEIVLVSLRNDDLEGQMSNVSISDGVKYIYDYAESEGKACVINMSLGSHFGPHDGSSLFDQLADKMQGEGRLLVGSAGNEGKDAIHVSKHIRSPQDTLKTLLDIPDFSDNPNIVEIWGEENEDFSIQLVSRNMNTGKEKEISHEIKAGKKLRGEIIIPVNIGTLQGNIGVYPAGKNAKNNRHNILLISSLNRLRKKENIGLKIFNTSGVVHAWFAENGEFTNKNLKEWTEGDSDYTVGEIGGTGKKIISVGAFVSKKNYKNLAGETESINGGEKEDIADFSSLGPTLDGRMKPEITAPGATIISSYSGNKKVIQKDKYRFVKKTTIGSDDYYYGAMEGTSMAAPHVTGILALWLEACKDLTPEDIRTILKKTATKDDYSGYLNNNEWGYGKIDAYKGLIESLRLKEAITKEDSWVKINFIDKESMEIRILKKHLDLIKLQMWSVDGKMVADKKINSKNLTNLTVNLSPLPRGVYIVKTQSEGMKDVIEKIML